MTMRYVSVDFRDTTSFWSHLVKLRAFDAGKILIEMMKPVLNAPIQNMPYENASEWSSIMRDIQDAKEYKSCPNNTQYTSYIDVTDAHSYLFVTQVPLWQAACAGVGDLIIKNATSLDYVLPSGAKNFQFEASGSTFVTVEFSNFRNISTIRSILSGYDPRKTPTTLNKFKCDTKISIKSNYQRLSHLELSLDPRNFYIASYFGEYFSARLFGKDFVESKYIDLSELFYKYAQEQCPE